MDHTTAISLAVLACLVVAHLAGGGVRLLDRVPRSQWLSAAGGVSVAYVFAHLLPELATTQREVEESAEGALTFVEDHVYVLGLVGFVLFYGVELAARAADRGSGGAFWLSISSYAVYNAVIGYLLVQREEGSVVELVLFGVAIGLHFVVNDFGLRRRHEHDYVSVGRWILVAALCAGWLAGRATELDDAAVGLLIAFLAGGVILNAVKEELPEERQSRFGVFAAAAVAYAMLLQAV